MTLIAAFTATFILFSNLLQHSSSPVLPSLPCASYCQLSSEVHAAPYKVWICENDTTRAVSKRQGNLSFEDF